MLPETVKDYFTNFIQFAKYFDSKNTVCKYYPSIIGLDTDISKSTPEVFCLGLSRDIVDIFNESELNLARVKNQKEYLPNDNFIIVNKYPLEMFPYFQNILYKNVN